MSLKSEKKSTEKHMDNACTNPTSETSSMKCSSVASQQENLQLKQEPVMDKHTSAKCDDNGQWMTSTNKKRVNKNKKNQRNGKKNKQNKNKPKQGKQQQLSVNNELKETTLDFPLDKDLDKKDLNSNLSNIVKPEIKEQEKPKEETLMSQKIKKQPVQAKETPKSKGNKI
jgi:hypothetical protein